ncbi:hypothetical protein K461DRAFT_295849 [Myriangium duriaei CBS 260.36]|uniref:INO80 complex subunit F domain-containing protein n=1 Tax=Myriangium duriaei CBS 260.36 TaxID=1168546 RepID=A0A9P4ME07_9PEZI|nr:hypothetical protein K461DRAFT_295849 [Myriangium duriaei CBS 260.36]
MPEPPASATANTPLAPSVEKAYYRKCIELKRRLNEVEEANDAARARRTRLDRAILKMRLERAFLLEQLSRRTAMVDPEDEPEERREIREEIMGPRGEGAEEEEGEEEGE